MKDIHSDKGDFHLELSIHINTILMNEYCPAIVPNVLFMVLFYDGLKEWILNLRATYGGACFYILWFQDFDGIENSIFEQGSTLEITA